MSEFHNPYQFIPTNTSKAKQTVSYRSINDLQQPTNKFVRHDFFHREGLTGKIECNIRTLSAMVIGANQQPDQAKQETKTPGVVEPYQVCINDQSTLAIPGSSVRGLVSNIVEIISQSSMRVLSNLEEGALSVRKPARGGTGHDSALSELGVLLKTDNGWKIYPLGSGQSVGNYRDKRSDSQHDTQIKQQDCFQLVHNDHRATANGIYYIRGAMNDGTELAPNKLRETFFPSERLDDVEDDSRHLSVDDQVVAICERMLRDRYQQTVKSDDNHRQRNLLPKGYRDDPNNRGWQQDSDNPLLCDGDLIYYRTRGTDVVELSYSRIWRRQLPGNLGTAFVNHGGENAVPWNQQRSELTPAEALFGVTEDRDPKTTNDAPARNLASRVRFYDAIASSEVQLHDQVLLKALSSPKPPSPALYFCADGLLREKTDLNLNTDAPNGRKYYLPHQHSLSLDKYENGLWQTQPNADPQKERAHLKLSCTPVPKDEEFACEIHFENLSEEELGLLLHALQPGGSDKKFIHRIGLGKPLGLGHITITDVNVQVVDRHRLYTSLPDPTSLETYPYERWTGTPSTALIDSHSFKTLQNLADPNNLDNLPVCYPYATSAGQQPYNEDKGYEWFSREQQPLAREPIEGAQNMKPLKSN